MCCLFVVCNAVLAQSQRPKQAVAPSSVEQRMIAVTSGHRAQRHVDE